MISESQVAQYLYEQGRRELRVGVPWEQLTVGQRDEFCDMVQPIVPILERFAQELRKIAESHRSLR